MKILLHLTIFVVLFLSLVSPIENLTMILLIGLIGVTLSTESRLGRLIRRK